MQFLRVQSPMWAVATLLMAGLFLVLAAGQFDLLCSLLILGAILILSSRSKPAAILATIAYLTLMGDLRRIVAITVGQPAQDPLLLIGPAVAFFLAVPLLLRLRLRDLLSKAMLLLLIIMAIEIVNPAQGGLAVGLSGALFYIAPVLWFWVGRQYATPAVVEALLYRVLLPLAALAVLLGFAQTFVGFLPYEQAWIDVASKTYTSLYVGGSIRAFGFSVSAAEYATLLTLAAGIVVAAFFTRRRAWAVLFPFLITGLVLASGRTLILKLVLAIVLVWVAREGKSLSSGKVIKLGVLFAAGLFAIFTLASHFAPAAESGGGGKRSAVQDALAHEAGGLAHPTDERYSTAGVHSQMLLNGITQGFVHPLGYGLGATTLAAQRFGSGDTGSSEIDFSDMFISLGFLGGLTYSFVILLALRDAFTYTRTVRREVSLPVLAVLMTCIAGWLIGGQYSTSSLVFLLIGATVCKGSGEQAQSLPRVAETQASFPRRPSLVGTL